MPAATAAASSGVDERELKRLDKSLERMSLTELQKVAKQHDTSGMILSNPIVSRSAQTMRIALHELFHAAEEENDDSPEVIEAWLAANAAAWPEGERPPPRDAAEALDPDGAWGLAACGVEVCECAQNPGKGKGAFALRPIEAGRVVGVYAGEYLTQRQFSIRHDANRAEAAGGPKPLPLLRPLTTDELRSLDDRRSRLEALGDGAPMGGAKNGGGYVFGLLPDTDTNFGDRIAYIDAEDPNLSNWCRYVNHAPEDSHLCNLESGIDGSKQMAWLVSRRAIAAGEELCFDYGGNYHFEDPPLLDDRRANVG